jgi:hypothetical protein
MKSYLLLVTSLLSCLTISARAAEPALIPKPENMTVRERVFALNAETKIITDSRKNNVSRATGAMLAERLRAATGLPLPFKDVIGFSRDAVPGAIKLTPRAATLPLGRRATN